MRRVATFMMSTSAFLQHFIAQHGPRPHPYGRDAELLIAISDGQRAEQTLREVELWEARMGAALYAWQANDSMSGVGTAAGKDDRHDHKA